jgi:hypothetical protein
LRQGNDLGGDSLLKGLKDLAGLRETAQLLLGEDQVVPDRDLEDASAAADELGLDAELLLDLSRQTGGAGIVVSARAVLDGDMGRHGEPPFGSHYTQEKPALGGLAWRGARIG